MVLDVGRLGLSFCVVADDVADYEAFLKHTLLDDRSLANASSYFALSLTRLTRRGFV